MRELANYFTCKVISCRAVACHLSLLFTAALLVASTGPWTQPLSAQEPTAKEPQPRELLVPFSDLHLLLGNETRRVFMTREEFAELKATANRSPDEPLPQQVALLSAEYNAELETGRAVLSGDLQLEVLAEGLHALPLNINGVGIRSAELDDQPAALVGDQQGQVLLIVQGRGLHRLRLEMVLPIATAAAQQSLSWTVPVPPATKFHMSVPGNVEMKSGAAIVKRRVDDAAGVTHFDLLPAPGQMSLVLSLNNKRLRDETTLLARGVLISEITQGYQRLHANLSMNVLHGAADEFRIGVPNDYEITQVTSPLLARWSVEDSQEADSGRVLVVKLRELVSDRATIQLRADRLKPQLGEWQMPQLQPLKVAGFASVVGILIEEQLASESIDSQGLIPIDNQILTAALPPSVLELEPGAPRIRPLATYYAAQADTSLKTSFNVQPAELKVTTNLQLSLHDRGLEINGGFALLPSSEKLFAFDFSLPPEWTVDTVTFQDGRPLTFERHELPTGWRVRVQLPGGLAPGSTTTILFHANRTPPGWLGNWTEQTVELPQISIAKSEQVRESGAFAVRSFDDLKLQPENLSGLIVISDSEKSKYGCADVPLNFAWRYTEEGWQGSLKVTRAAPRITGRVLSFFQISPDALTAHYELFYDCDQASTQRVSFSLPESTPAELTVRGLGDTVVKETTHQIVDGRRLWTIQLADKKIGRIQLSVDFNQPLNADQLTDWSLPEARTENVVYQSGLIAVEGHAELDINVRQHPRMVDMGELIDAQYQVGSRLLGVYSYAGNQAVVTLQSKRRAIHGLPTTIVERAELVSLVGAGGNCQTAARFLLRTKAQYLEVRLPEGAKLWSIMVDSLPALPERQADRIVVALKATSASQLRDVQVVYEHAIDSVGLRSHVELLAPSLWHRAERDTVSEPVPLVDLHWEAVLPTGYRLVQHAGTLTLQGEIQPNASPLERVYDALTAPFVGAKWRTETVTLSLDNSKSMPPMSGPAAGQAQSSSAPSRGAELAGQAAAGQAAAPPADDPFAGPTVPRTPPAPAAAATAPAPQEPTAQLPGLQGSPGKDGAAQVAVAPSVAWALDGLRCLNIDLAPAKFGESVSFESLGVDPMLSVTIVNQRRWHWLGTACGLALFIVGLLRTGNRFTSRLKYVLVIVLGTKLVSLVSGWTIEMQPILEAEVIGSLALLIVTIFSALGRAVIVRGRRVAHAQTTTKTVSASSLLLFLAIVALPMIEPAQSVCAQEAATPAKPATPITSLSELAALIDALPGNPSITIPADAIVVPYDAGDSLPESREGEPIDRQQKLLVPYDTYAQLWNKAHPDQRLTSQPPIVPYAWAAAKYSAVLNQQDALEVTGSFKIELFGDAGVTIPLALEGGILQSMTVDGGAARVQLVEPMPPVQLPQSIQAAPQPNPTAGVMLLHLSGKGVKDIQLVVRLKIERRGGWRAVDGRLPAAPATGLTLQVPEAQTEVRLTGMADRAAHEFETANNRIETALPADGRAAWQWRAKIAEAAVDQGLSVEARSVFDVQEDGLRLSWQGNFEFRRGRRESFTLLVPGDYLVQKVLGSNVRGWSVLAVGDSQQLTVDLLTAVAERETLVVQLFRKHAKDGLATGETVEAIEAPVIRVPDAMLQKGQLTIRRSRLLDLRSGASSGLSRIDMPDNSQWLAEQTDASPVPLVPFQAFQYSQVPYSYQLTAQPTQSRVQVTARTLLNLSELESSLESQLILNVTERQQYRLRISAPKNWKLQRPIVPAAFEWNRIAGDDQQTIEIRFADGITGLVPIVLRGSLDQSLVVGADGVIPSLSLPKIVVQEADQQSGEIVVVSDPAFAVRAEQLQNCELGLLGSANRWLSAAQQPLAQLLVHYSNPELSGQLQIVRRVPQVTGYSISNIKVTDRAIEETLFFEFAIRTAGIRQVSLIVPAYLRDSRVRGPLIRSQTWSPTTTEVGAPVRLVVELQEEVMGQYSLILEHDRLLSSGPQEAPVPTIETGKTEHRFVTLENTGRDELIIDKISGMERVQRSQSQWNILASTLGGKTNEAFVVSEPSQDARLTFSTKDREIVETVGARIGIAQTLMIVDANGAYRASQEIRIENRTEQYLEIELPAGAQLWTVLVAGEPVKPMTANAAAGTGQRVRLPLVKTAAGDLDYPVLIKYGGQLPRPGGLGITHFPLVQTLNIKVELSQVRLRLPPGLQWWNFGGSMARVQSDDELTAGWLAFRTRQLNELTQILNKSEKLDFSRARAMNNLKQLGEEVAQVQASNKGRGNEDLQRQLASNGAAWFEAQKELAKPSKGGAEQESTNRSLLYSRVQSQQNRRSLNVANDDAAHFQKAEDFVRGKSSGSEFNSQWLSGNQLDVAGKVDSLQAGQSADKDQPMATEDRKKLRDEATLGRRLSKGKQADFDSSGLQMAKPSAPQLQMADQELATKSATTAESKPDDRAAQVFRYQQQLEERSLMNRGAMQSATPSYNKFNANGRPEDAFGLGMGGGMGGADMGGVYGMGGGMDGGMGGGVVNNQFSDVNAAWAFNNAAGANIGNVVAAPGYLVSLDTQLPVRGDEYLFTTPRGATEITAQSVSSDTLQCWSMIGGLLVLGTIAWWLLKRFEK